MRPPLSYDKVSSAAFCLATGFWLVPNPRTRPVHYGEPASPVCIICVVRLKLDFGTSLCYDSAFASDVFRGRYLCKIWLARTSPLRVDLKVRGG